MLKDVQPGELLLKTTSKILQVLLAPWKQNVKKSKLLHSTVFELLRDYKASFMHHFFKHVNPNKKSVNKKSKRNVCFFLISRESLQFLLLLLLLLLIHGKVRKPTHNILKDVGGWTFSTDCPKGPAFSEACSNVLIRWIPRKQHKLGDQWVDSQRGRCIDFTRQTHLCMFWDCVLLTGPPTESTQRRTKAAYCTLCATNSVARETWNKSAGLF